MEGDHLPDDDAIPLAYTPERSCRCRCHVCSQDSAKLTDDDEGHAEFTELDWVWDAANTTFHAQVTDSGREVIFHSRFSSGTAAIRGNTPLTDDQHYWEIKMTTAVYGTDMMVGCGTSNVNLSEYASKFVSLLGLTEDSWGLSYSGTLSHNGSKRVLCKPFGQGMTIGIHLDMWLGKMSFFRNGKYIGVAASGDLRGKQIYPMVCSTAARTGMRVVRSTSFPTSLQFMCCQVLRQCIPADQDVTQAVKIAPGLKLFLLNNLDWLLRPYLPSKVHRTVCGLRKRLASSGVSCLHQPDEEGGAAGQRKRARIDTDVQPAEPE